MMSLNKTVLITGCSTGFGKLAAKLFQKRGWNVIATMRTPSREKELTELENVLVARLDVTNQESISEAVKAGMDKFGRIDALINNAGFSGHGVLEQYTDEAIHNLFNTNVYGLIRVTREILPIMRKQREGVIVNVSSLSGLLASPLCSIYSSTKFAVEGFSEALALEYAPFNIKVKVVAPGAFETNLYSSMSNDLLNNGDEEVRGYCLKLINKMDETVKQMMEQTGEQADPQEVADKMYECVTEETPVHNVVGKDAEGLVHMRDTMSEKELLQMVSRMLVPELDD